MDIAPDGRSLYVVNYESGTISKLRTSDVSVLQTVDACYHPIGIAYEPVTRRVWVACYTDRCWSSTIDEAPRALDGRVGGRGGRGSGGRAGRAVGQLARRRCANWHGVHRRVPSRRPAPRAAARVGSGEAGDDPGRLGAAGGVPAPGRSCAAGAPRASAARRSCCPRRAADPGRRVVAPLAIVGVGYNSLWERGRRNLPPGRPRSTARRGPSSGAAPAARQIVWVTLRDAGRGVIPSGALWQFDAYAWYFPYVNERLRRLDRARDDLVLAEWDRVSSAPASPTTPSRQPAGREPDGAHDPRRDRRRRRRISGRCRCRPAAATARS